MRQGRIPKFGAIALQAGLLRQQFGRALSGNEEGKGDSVTSKGWMDSIQSVIVLIQPLDPCGYMARLIETLRYSFVDDENPHDRHQNK
ncbi:MAG: hypothetical protein ABSG72_02815 [Candidatus Sulfotelmatobacter sp.]